MSYIIGYVRLLLDTNIIVSALRSSDGASAALLRLAINGQLDLIATTAVVLEYESVIKRPEHRLVHGLSDNEINGFMAALASVMKPVEVWIQWRPLLNDPNDELFLDAAVNGKADCLVTFNIKHFVEPLRRFGIAVLGPGETLRRMRNG